MRGELVIGEGFNGESNDKVQGIRRGAKKIEELRVVGVENGDGVGTITTSHSEKPYKVDVMEIVKEDVEVFEKTTIIR